MTAVHASQSRRRPKRTNRRQPVNASQLIVDRLVANGVEIVFGYPGGAILPVYDALYDSPIRHMLVRHEQAAAHIADGYARATGRAGGLHGYFGSGSHQSGDGPCDRLHGLDSDGRNHRQRADEPDRDRRLSRGRHHRNHAADHQA